nr:unnamed protein product [Callosobruchus chinensis]
MDFSENYNCKYAEEVQSAHFGGSKSQISLHTSVFYYISQSSKRIESVCLCTLSENLRHDPVAICVHIEPIIATVKQMVPKVRKIHFLSDGPSTQYRNKLMFQLMVKYLANEFDVDAVIWHYSESGHGKGAPDGVGGCLKRVADAAVAKGADIPDFNKLFDILSENCRGIIIKKVNSCLYTKINELVQKVRASTFKGTMSVHKITWSKADMDVLHARRLLSCLRCGPDEICVHYELGQIPVQQDMQLSKSILSLNNFLAAKYAPTYIHIQFSTKCLSIYLRLLHNFLNSSSRFWNDDEDDNNYSSDSSDNLLLAKYKKNIIESVKFICKKSERHYIGRVLNKCNDDLEIRFMRNSAEKCVFPEQDDVCSVDINDMVTVLPEPHANKRKQYLFHFSFGVFKNVY